MKAMVCFERFFKPQVPSSVKYLNVQGRLDPGRLRGDAAHVHVPGGDDRVGPEAVGDETSPRGGSALPVLGSARRHQQRRLRLADRAADAQPPRELLRSGLPAAQSRHGGRARLRLQRHGELGTHHIPVRVHQRVEVKSTMAGVLPLSTYVLYFRITNQLLIK